MQLRRKLLLIKNIKTTKENTGKKSWGNTTEYNIKVLFDWVLKCVCVSRKLVHAILSVYLINVFHFVSMYMNMVFWFW